MDEEWPHYNNIVHNEFDLFNTSTHNHIFQHDHGDDMDGHHGATTIMRNTDDANNVAADQGNNDGQDHSVQRMDKRRANYHRLRGEQIQQLEAVFQDCPCPDEKLRKNLSERLGMSTKQVKFWFQNKCTFTKVKMQQRETQNRLAENKRLKSEHQAIKLAFQNKTCLKCSGVMVQTQGTSERHLLYTENMRLKEELLHATTYLTEGLRRNGK
ncbi:homeobox-leucine zipper protein ROC4-like [Hordeum vulgare subsp. vulgare]|uniref:Homeobox domain-containing protein n=1 Tax=Hordeum vulgare subsp. vulgare TaxID=112509 RepID=A0A8I6XBX0_HORVV|nr:homeobox-leucine zipper protein ROC4-like [Hordeum vulgare subsp. vulgare]